MTRDTIATRVEPAALLARLDAIAESLRNSGHALALIGLGSVGLELDRLDSWSDLDFFAIVEPGWKQRYIGDLDWLEAAHPLGWRFRNTVDGYKALMTDGVFCEFAVFEPGELGRIPYSPGRLVWARPDAADGLARPKLPLPAAAPPGAAWIVGELLSCLLVGLKRWHRGERLSAARFVQGYAVDRLVELEAHLRPSTAGHPDPFNRDRRLEVRHPALAIELASLVPGYERTPEAALAMLDALRVRGVTVDADVESLIRGLAARAAD